MSLMAHLWQSTVCVGIAALLDVVLRRASARTRHTIWLLASLKFFVPLSVFARCGKLHRPTHIDTGHAAGGGRHSMARPVAVSLDSRRRRRFDGAGLPFGIDRQGLLALALVWASGVAALAAWRWRQWRGLSRLARASTRLDCGREAGDPAARPSRVDAASANRAPSMPVQRRARHPRHPPSEAAMAGRTLGSALGRRARGHSLPRSVSRRSAGQRERLDPHGGRDRVLVSPSGLVARSATRERARARV